MAELGILNRLKFCYAFQVIESPAALETQISEIFSALAKRMRKIHLLADDPGGTVNWDGKHFQNMTTMIYLLNNNSCTI